MPGRKVLREKEIASCLVGGARATPARSLKCITLAECEDFYGHNVGVRAQNLIHGKECPIVSLSSFVTNFQTKIVRKRTSLRTITWSRKRKNCSSGFETFDVEVPEKLSRVKYKYWGKQLAVAKETGWKAETRGGGVLQSVLV